MRLYSNCILYDATVDSTGLPKAMAKDPAKLRKQNVSAHLRRAVLTLDLQPGTDLDETTLCEQFELSRTPLREVFRQLAGEGYLEWRENRGVRVSEMSHTTLREFFLVAPMIYGAVMRLAAQNADAAQIAALKQAQMDFRAALHSGSAPDRALANNRFHEITGEMSGNAYLIPSFQRLLIDHARISMTFYRPQDDNMARNVAAASAQHDAIIAAIETGNEADAAQLADDHWNLSRGQIELFVMPASLDIPLGDAPRQSAL